MRLTFVCSDFRRQSIRYRLGTGIFCFVVILFCAFCQAQVVSPEQLTDSEKREVIEAAWKSFRDRFYDLNFRGVNWGQVRRNYLIRVAQVRTRQQLVDLVRQMIATLHNSHSGVVTEEEYKRTRYILPFFFDSLSGRVFVSYVFQPRQPESKIPLQFGDEILSVDGEPATRLRPDSVFWTEPVMSNPYFGEPYSTARLRILRGGVVQNMDVQRIKKFSDVESLVYQDIGPGTAYLRFLKMDSSTISPDVLRAALQRVKKSKTLLIDVRHCVGGDAAVLDVIGGFLLGPGVELLRGVPRGASPNDKNVNVERTSDFGSVHEGKTVVLVDGNTESGPETLAAALKEYGGAKIVGSRTRGAFNGATEAIDLPFEIGILVVPIDRGVSPNGKEYEGIGIAPDVGAVNTAKDFEVGRDAALETVQRHLLGHPSHKNRTATHRSNFKGEL